MIVLLVLLCVVLAGLCLVSTFFAIRWAKIIFMLEDDLEEALDTLDEAVETLTKLTEFPMFYESPDMKPQIDAAMADVRSSTLSVMKLVETLTDRSNQRYIREEEVAAPATSSGETQSQ